ncbi:MAG: HK97 family phage prohead protease [Neomegalonema sp.]|nr:HK97 family phage prohead protease [Neomegalonema sp.]
MFETKFLSSRLDPSTALELGEEGRVSGYGALFNLLDEGGDVITPGAFAASLSHRPVPVRFLWQHDPATPIGVWESVIEDARGLRVEGRLVLETQAGREAAALLRAGAIDGLSIGYRTRRADKTDGGRRLVEVALWEVSLVTFPMQPAARTAPSPSPAPTQPSPPSEPDHQASHALQSLLNRACAVLA